jgi:predicted transcriptional regulator
MSSDTRVDLERAVQLLGPLEGRIMRVVWTDIASKPFVVRDVQAHMPELAYTTVMTTLNRLVNKGLLDVKAVRGRRAHEYSCALTARAFLARASKDQVAQIVEQFGDAAIAAFSEHLQTLSPEQRQRLEDLAR